MTGNQHIASSIPLLFLSWQGCDVLMHSELAKENQMFEQAVSFVGPAVEYLFVPVHPSLYIFCLTGFFIGVLLPDLDAPYSKAKNKLYHALNHKEHRTWLHSIYAVIFLCCLGFFRQVFFWAALGYFFHLLCDHFSKCGISWTQPVSGYRHFGKGDAKVKKGRHLVLYRNDTQAWLVCAALWLTASYVAVVRYAEIIVRLKHLFSFL